MPSSTSEKPKLRPSISPAEAERRAALKDFQRIPGVGRSIAEDLWNLGFRAVPELRGEDPQALYDRFCALVGTHVDRCMLYVFRCAVYFASEERHDPERLKWWNWKDEPEEVKAAAAARRRNARG
ncbi:MAG TPA: helix-hairpin-helix domain-containing protein [Longimicrobium sp.]|nr:helix-hairpin-helix domain-containing protein [Longimicrobium sp.]